MHNRREENPLSRKLRKKQAPLSFLPEKEQRFVRNSDFLFNEHIKNQIKSIYCAIYAQNTPITAGSDNEPCVRHPNARQGFRGGINPERRGSADEKRIPAAD